MLRVPGPAGPGQRRRHRADRAAARPRRAVWRARADRGARARTARSPPPATGLTPPPWGHHPSRPQPAPAVVVPAADPRTALAPAGPLQLAGPTAATTPTAWFAGPDASLAGTGQPPAGQQPRCAPACRATPRRRPSRTRPQSHRLRDARSRSRAAAWPQAGQPAPEEEIIVTTGTPHAGPAARQARAATTAPAPRKLGLVLAVIATAQLMVALDLTIVNVALPHIRQALGFSGPNLEWMVNAYAVAFGGLLLLGGRAGDLLGRRRIFIAGLLVFSLASLLGGLATGQAWLIAARAVQGAGAAMAAPTALSLIAVTFPEGRARNRAVAVYSAMAIVGIVAGLIAGGLLVTYLSWRWVLFVNVPIGLAVAALAARVLPETGRRGGRFDLPGALTATA